MSAISNTPGAGSDDAFKPYLDAVIASGERTRRTSYTILFLMFFLVFAIRNTLYPAWYDTLLARMEDYYSCHTSNGQARTAKANIDCNRLDAEYENDLPLPKQIPIDIKNLNSQEQEQIRRFQKRVDALIQANVSSFVASIPLIGITINSNDLYLVSGPGLAILLLLLFINLESDHFNVRRAAANADTPRARDLLRMTQVINRKDTGSFDLTRAAQIVYIFMLLVMPTMLNIFILIQFIIQIQPQEEIVGSLKGLHTLVNLLGPWQAAVELTLGIVFSVIVAAISWKCWGESRAIDDVMKMVATGLKVADA